MKTKGLLLLTVMIMLFLSSKPIIASPSESKITMTNSGQTIDLNWTSVPGSWGYNLYYADYSNPVLNKIDMGLSTKLQTTLPKDFTYYVAVKSYNGGGEGDYSNVIIIKGFTDQVNKIQYKYTDHIEFENAAQILHIAPIDINNDGFKDIVLMNGAPGAPFQVYDNPFMFFINQGGTSFIKDDSFISGEFPYMIHPCEWEIADFNGDGRDDLLVIGTGDESPPFLGEEAVLLLSDNNGMYNASDQLNSGSVGKNGAASFKHGMSVGDVDGDGDIDIFIVSLLETNVHELLINDGTGNFTSHPEMLIDKELYSTWDKVANPKQPNANGDYITQWVAEFVDVDTDGDLDLIVGRNNAPDQLFFNDGDGAFSSHIELPKSSFFKKYNNKVYTVGIWSTDLNYDGYMDIILSQTKHDPMDGFSRHLQVLINSGDGKTFYDESYRIPIKETDQWIRILLLEDINNDGHIDLIVSQYATFNGPVVKNNEVLFINDGSGYFNTLPEKAMNNLTFWQGGEKLCPIDMDNDGIKEFVSTYFSENADWWFWKDNLGSTITRTLLWFKGTLN
ncbi:MAG: hypothetical protein HOD92_14955 [Deltaproteobacteria bacterium]|jgi:hypothetical protein|nr:hypothetical protein [Deltaproteobacteria bacterium]MBT4525595.1 hypothetical protein [Deltaproteobacteria bacterium]MBT5529610.1 hypothetical protein [Cytophagia bacterium]MBT5992557.1 hypothetical protein [Bacteroidota bacterium]